MQRYIGTGIAALASIVSMAQVLAQEAVRVRGTIERIDGEAYVVQTRDGGNVRLALTSDAGVASSVKSTISDIKPGSYIGIAAVPQADGVLRAIEAHIFHDSMRGTNEGHRPWDLLPKSSMTNAVVNDVVSVIDGHSVTLKYDGGQQSIFIAPDTVVVTYLPGQRAELVPGAVIFVPVANRQSDGTLLTQRIMVGRDTPPPQ